MKRRRHIFIIVTMLLNAALAGFHDCGDGESLFGFSDASVGSSPSHLNSSNLNESRDFESQQQSCDDSFASSPCHHIHEPIDSLPLEEIFSRLVRVTAKETEPSQASVGCSNSPAISSYPADTTFDGESDESLRIQQKISGCQPLPRRQKSFNLMHSQKWRSLSGKFKNLLQGKLSGPVPVTDISLNPDASGSSSKQLLSERLDQGNLKTEIRALLQQQKSRELIKEALAMVSSSTKSNDRQYSGILSGNKPNKSYSANLSIHHSIKSHSTHLSIQNPRKSYSANLSMHNLNADSRFANDSDKPRRAIPFPASFSASNDRTFNEGSVKYSVSVNAIANAIPAPERNVQSKNSPSPLIHDNSCQHILPGTPLYVKAKSGPLTRLSANQQKEYRMITSSFSGPQSRPSGLMHKSLSSGQHLHLRKNTWVNSKKRVSTDRPSQYSLVVDVKRAHLDQGHAKSQNNPSSEDYRSNTGNNFSIKFSGKLSPSFETRASDRGARSKYLTNVSDSVACATSSFQTMSNRNGYLRCAPSFNRSTTNPALFRAQSMFSSTDKSSKDGLTKTVSLSRFATSGQHKTSHSGISLSAPSAKVTVSSDLRRSLRKTEGRKSASGRIEVQIREEFSRGKEVARRYSVDVIQQLIKAHTSMRQNQKRASRKINNSLNRPVQGIRWGSLWRKAFSCFYSKTESTRKTALQIRSLTDS